MWALVLFLGEDLESVETTDRSFTVGDERPPTSCFRVTTFPKSAFWVLGSLRTLTHTMLTPPTCALPSPEISLLLSLSSVSKRVNPGQLQHTPLTL